MARVEVFILHQDTDAIGYCGHFIGLGLSIDLSLCYRERTVTLSSMFINFICAKFNILCCSITSLT